MVLADLLIAVEALEEVHLEGVGVEVLLLTPALLEDPSNNLACDTLVLFDALGVQRTVLGRSEGDPEFGLIPHLRKLPLLATLKVIVEGHLLDQLEGLELKNLPKQVLVSLLLHGRC